MSPIQIFICLSIRDLTTTKIVLSEGWDHINNQGSEVEEIGCLVRDHL